MVTESESQESEGYHFSSDRAYDLVRNRLLES